MAPLACQHEGSRVRAASCCRLAAEVESKSQVTEVSHWLVAVVHQKLVPVAALVLRELAAVQGRTPRYCP